MIKTKKKNLQFYQKQKKYEFVKIVKQIFKIKLSKLKII